MEEGRVPFLRVGEEEKKRMMEKMVVLDDE